MQSLPNQAIPSSKKDETFHRNTYDAILSMSNFNNYNSEYEALLNLKKYYEGDINENDYDNLLKPFGVKMENLTAKIRNHNIIKPIVNILIGEKAKRALNDSVVVANPDVVSKKEEQQLNAVRGYLYQKFINELNALGEDTGAESRELPSIDEFNQQFNLSYKDERAKHGQEILDYIKYDVEIYDKFQDLFKQWLIYGRCVSFKNVVKDRITYDDIQPYHVDYERNESLKFIEDAGWQVIRNHASASDILARYSKEISESEKKEELIAYLQNPTGKGSNFNISFSTPNPSSALSLVEEIRVYWKSIKKVGYVTYFDEFGIPQIKEVEEDYKLQEGESVDWEYQNEVREVVMLDDTYMILARAYPYERALVGIGGCKLPVNGRIYNPTTDKIQSFVSDGVTYQILYNAYMYRLELSVAKAKDVIALFDLNLIPDGMDMKDWFYWIDKTGIGFVDLNQEGVKSGNSLNQLLDLTNKTLMTYIELIRFILSQWENLSGVTPQRKGEIGPYEGKGVSERAVIQSSHITEEWYRMFVQFERKELQGLLDLSKYAYLDGKQAMFVRPDTTYGYITIDGQKHMESVYGIFISNNLKEQDDLQNIKGLAQSMVQNGVPVSTISEVIRANNFSSIVDKIKESEKQLNEQAAKTQEAQQKAQQEMMQLEQEKLQLEYAKVEASKPQIDPFKADEIEIKKDELSLKEKELDETIRNNKAKEAIDMEKVKKMNTKS